ncbi:mitochondrial dicarboxylate carrier-like [Spodoptera litura]|uniref:Mitochondrial dicarboxylate carrier-like n=1 Tax=Spodoptera litura TaxID=69820 RepID=A0A9J7ENL4_SPOLT|nr:mitochondrial dicarboxylate carrier-like [Spodoptera litura]XP_022834851.1 mitochondrial dicarboxylate carrier-like [Spodoptera litura]XP_022834852.1 mitochondrial dicarboxylate carrier-like [Spodoptera litura]
MGDQKDSAGPKEVRVSRWYFGGLSSAGAACVTHPLDLLKVQMQTQKGKNISMSQLVGIVVKNDGILGLYNGISASLLRQLTYSTVRFGIYEVAKQHFTPKDGKPIPFYMSTLIAGVGGFAGGFMGNPADLINVRMQNDVKLPPEQRRNYKNAVHGLWRVVATEGITRLWAGASMTCSRAALMTIGQVAFYDQIKMLLLSTSFFHENVVTHVTASLLAGGVATTMTQPVDVLKTRVMNAKPGEFKGIFDVVFNTAKEGPLAFFKGYIPAFVRLAPHTILTFVFLEQLRMNYGFIKN